MSTNSLVGAFGASAVTVAVLLTVGVAANVAAPVGLLIGGITALVLFVNSPAAVPAVQISTPAKKSKKAAKKEAAVKRPPTPPVDDDSASDGSASEVSEDDAEEASQSKNAKKKAKKKQKEAEAKAAAAAAAKKAEEEKKKAAKKTAAPTPAPAAAAPVAKKEEGKKSKKNKEEKKAAPAPVPAPRTPSPPPQVEEEEEEFFQTSKASKKKAKQDAKKAEKKEVDATPAPAPKKTPAPATAPVASPVAAATAPKKAEKKAAAPAPVEKAAEDDGWETAKAAKPTIAQKQAAKVANAEKKVVEESTVNTASDVYSEFVDIPARAVPAIIGSKGAVLKALQEGTQAKIEIPPASSRALDSLTVRVIVYGEPEAVRFAKTCVKSLAEKGFSAVTHPGFVSDDIYVESKQHGFIIGPKGTTLKTIQTKSGTRIQMPERGGNDRVLIVGPKEGVKAAKEAIKQLITDGFSAMTHEGTDKKEIPYPREKIGWLIGASGQTIKSIQGNTKCKINIPRDNSSFVIVVGPAAGIAQAEKEILRTLEPKQKKGKKDTEEEEVAEEKEADEAEPEGPQAAYDAWTQAETATTEDQLWQ